MKTIPKSFPQEGQCMSQVFQITKVLKNYKCPYDNCKRKFRESCNLKVHIRIHTGEKRFKCKVCPKSFSTLGNYKSHTLMHQGIRQYKCDQPGCRKRFAKQRLLQIHQRTHLGLKPFSCFFEECGRKFFEKGHYMTHLKIHKSKKPYLCNFVNCKKSFETLNLLHEHKEFHLFNQFHCEKCNVVFKTKMALELHFVNNCRNQNENNNNSNKELSVTKEKSSNEVYESENQITNFNICFSSQGNELQLIEGSDFTELLTYNNLIDKLVNDKIVNIYSIINYLKNELNKHNQSLVNEKVHMRCCI